MTARHHVQVPQGVAAELISIGKTANRNDDFVFVRPILRDRMLGVIGDFPGDSMAGTNEACLAFLREFVAERVDTWADVLVPASRVLHMVADAVNDWLNRLERPAKTTLLALVWDVPSGEIHYISYGDSGLAICEAGGLHFLREGDRHGARVAAGFLPARSAAPVQVAKLSPKGVVFAFTDGFWENTQNIFREDLLRRIFSSDQLTHIVKQIYQELIEPAVRRDDFSILLLKGESMTNTAKDGTAQPDPGDMRAWAQAEIQRQLDAERALDDTPNPVEDAFLEILRQHDAMEQRLRQSIEKALHTELDQALSKRFEDHVKGSQTALSDQMRDLFSKMKQQMKVMEGNLHKANEQTSREAIKQSEDLSRQSQRLADQVKQLEAKVADQRKDHNDLRRVVGKAGAASVGGGVVSARNPGGGMAWWYGLDPAWRSGIGVLLALLLFFGLWQLWPSSPPTEGPAPEESSQSADGPSDKSPLQAYFDDAESYAAEGEYQKAVQHLRGARDKYSVPWRDSEGDRLLANYEAQLQGASNSVTSEDLPETNDDARQEPTATAIFEPAAIGDPLLWLLGSNQDTYQRESAAIYAGVDKMAGNFEIPTSGSKKAVVPVPGFSDGSLTLTLNRRSGWLNQKPLSKQRVAALWLQSRLETNLIDAEPGNGTRTKYLTVVGQRVQAFQSLRGLLAAENFKTALVDNELRKAFGWSGNAYDANALKKELAALNGPNNADGKRPRLQWLANRLGLNVRDDRLLETVLAALASFQNLTAEGLYSGTVGQWNL